MNSPYYPPRARWYGRLFFFWFAFLRDVRLNRLHLPAPLTCLQFVFCLVVPGYVFFANDRRMLGWVFMGAYSLAAAVFLIGLGYPVSGIAFGLMISVHASSIIFLEAYRLHEWCTFGWRLLLALATLLAVWLAVYRPAIGFLERRWMMPLHGAHGVVVVRHAALETVKRGDWIGFRVAEYNQGGVRIQASYGIERVLGLAGDRIRFSPAGFEVNGVQQPLQPDMPVEGERVVPENCWFVWPDVALSGQSRAAGIYRQEIIRVDGMIRDLDYVGKAFRRWCGRRQLP